MVYRFPKKYRYPIISSITSVTHLFFFDSLKDIIGYGTKDEFIENGPGAGIPVSRHISYLARVDFLTSRTFSIRATSPISLLIEK